MPAPEAALIALRAGLLSSPPQALYPLVTALASLSCQVSSPHLTELRECLTHLLVLAHGPEEMLSKWLWAHSSHKYH